MHILPFLLSTSLAHFHSPFHDLPLNCTLSTSTITLLHFKVQKKKEKKKKKKKLRPRNKILSLSLSSEFSFSTIYVWNDLSQVLLLLQIFLFFLRLPSLWSFSPKIILPMKLADQREVHHDDTSPRHKSNRVSLCDNDQSWSQSEKREERREDTPGIRAILANRIGPEVNKKSAGKILATGVRENCRLDGPTVFGTGSSIIWHEHTVNEIVWSKGPTKLGCECAWSERTTELTYWLACGRRAGQWTSAIPAVSALCDPIRLYHLGIPFHPGGCTSCPNSSI